MRSLLRSQSLKLAIVFQGDEALRNTYAAIEPKPSAGAGVNVQAARALVEYVVSSEGRALIRAFGVKALGEPLFTPGDH